MLLVVETTVELLVVEEVEEHRSQRCPTAGKCFQRQQMEEVVVVQEVQEEMVATTWVTMKLETWVVA